MFLHKNMLGAKQMLRDALAKNMAIGAFNFSNMETLQAIVEVSNEENIPVIIQVSESALKYMGMGYVLHMVSAASEDSELPLCLHLDHGKSFDICKTCIDSGFSSVMIDKSSLAFGDNVELTKEVVEYAHKNDVSVEGELGVLAGVEDDIDVSSGNSSFTDPNMAALFVERTGIDSIAVAIGTSHGLNKGKNGNPRLDIQRLAEIREKIGSDFPIVLHGASSVYPDLVQKCNDFGGYISGAFGISDQDIKNCVQNGVAKINVDTDIRIAFVAGLLESFHYNSSSIDIRHHLLGAKESVKAVVRKKILSFVGKK